MPRARRQCDMKQILLAHAAATWGMVGLIWFVQIVHYPLFDRVGAADFPRYSAAHQRLTMLVVAPLMLVELATAIWLVCMPTAQAAKSLTVPGLLLLAVIWFSTIWLQVPQHQTLLNGFDPSAYRFLIDSNWLRTIAWSIRGAITLLLLASHMR